MADTTPKTTAPAAPGDTNKWVDIDPLTNEDIRAFRNQRNGDLTRWNPAVGLRHHTTTTKPRG